MQKLIVTVGTSLLRTSLLSDTSVRDHYEQIRSVRGKDGEHYANRVAKLKQATRSFLKSQGDKASAEIYSIRKWQAEFKPTDLKIYMVASDTLSSLICAEVIAEYLESASPGILGDRDFVIEGLQVENRHEFETTGLANLIHRLENVAAGYFENCVLNITGGFKATIPYATLYAQLRKIPVCYLFHEGENTGDLVFQPPAPIGFDTAIFEKYDVEFTRLANGGAATGEFTHDFRQQAGGCLFEYEGLLDFNPLGRFLWQNSQQLYATYYWSDEIDKEIARQGEIRRILATKFADSAYRAAKTEHKNDRHRFVLDDGKNPYRIFYLEDQGRIYIYKTFEDHAMYEDYLDDAAAVEVSSYASVAKLRKVKKLA